MMILNVHDADCPLTSDAHTLTVYVPSPSVTGDCKDWDTRTGLPELSTGLGGSHFTVAVCDP